MRMRKKKWAEPELAACPYYYEDAHANRGRWKSLFKHPENPLCIEMGCGKGAFISQIAIAEPNVNFIGVDMISSMLGVARRTVEKAYGEQGRETDNVILTALDITRLPDSFCSDDKAERIYINFCNPWPKPKQYKKRLTHTRQLENYKTILTEKGEIFFKTDNDELYQHSLGYFEQSGYEILYKTEDLHASGYSPNYITEHEIMYSSEGIKIKFIHARLIGK